MFKLKLASVLGATLLAGLCSLAWASSEKEVESFKKQPVKTVSELLADRETLRAWYAKCIDDPGRLEQTPHCINAHAADNRLKREKMIEFHKKRD